MTMVDSASASNSSLKRRESAKVVATSTVETTRKVLCGGFAGMFAKTIFAPLDRMRILYQTGEHGLTSPKQTTMSNIFRSIIEREGISGLWAGNGATILRVFPSKGIVFTSNDFWRNQLRSISNTAPHEHLSGPLGFLAGGLSGMTATGVTYPLDFVRGRISGKLSLTKDTSRVYNGIWSTLSLTVKEEGFFALYKGVTPALIGSIPYEGIKFGMVGFLDKAFPKHENDSLILRKIIFGGVGGAMSGLVMYPNDTVRRMLQMQGSRGTTVVYTGYWDCVRKNYAKHGIQRFYNGLTLNILRMAPNTAVQFGCYELLKNLTDGIKF